MSSKFRKQTPAHKLMCLSCLHLWCAKREHIRDFCPKCGAKGIQNRGLTKAGYQAKSAPALGEFRTGESEAKEATK